MTDNAYIKGSRVWIPHDENVWEEAFVVEDYSAERMQLLVETKDTREMQIFIIKSNADLPPLNLIQDFSLDEMSNLSSLSVVHEATIINLLRKRFRRRCIYNYCGASMLILNPHIKIPINSHQKILEYRGKVNLEPHVFALAERVYCQLEREKCDQSIVFSGESGAGKTENANHTILYLVTIGVKEREVKEKILASSTILQAFGNAKTIRNDNSSRFGKFIEIQYDNNHHIIGAGLKIYLLDRSRIISQVEKEQNFKIFYQIKMAKNCFLSLRLYEVNFDCFNREYSSVTDNLNNVESLNRIFGAFDVLGFSTKEQEEIIQILLATLQLGSLEFKKHEDTKIDSDKKSCSISELNHCENLVKLLSMDVKHLETLQYWLCHKKMTLQRDAIVQPMTIEEATRARDALSKYIYVKLFNWIVARINASFRSPCHVQSFIGILDLYGFEKLDLNSFEQFCINYVEEKIQQNFIQSVFKLEQEEYLSEGIEWNFIEFQDNESCVKLIEEKNGIIDTLDSRNKSPTNQNKLRFEGLKVDSETAKFFQKVALDPSIFVIHHFVDYVQYDSTEFLAKNLDAVHKEQLSILKHSKISIINRIVSTEFCLPTGNRKFPTQRRTPVYINPSKRTVASELRRMLSALTYQLKRTNPHYVRCIETNDHKKPFEFEAHRVAEQLRAYNVQETIKISAEGFSNRRTYQDFFLRYHCLSREFEPNSLKENCLAILTTHVQKSEDFRLGQTKVLMREPVVMLLERLRSEMRLRASLLIQRSVRRFLQRKSSEKLRCEREAAVMIQRVIRGFLGRRRAHRTLRSIVLVQACVRKFLAKVALDKLKNPRGQRDLKLLCNGLENNIHPPHYHLDSLGGDSLTMKHMDKTVLNKQSWAQIKNRVMNQLLFEKIDKLKEFRERKKIPDLFQIEYQEHDYYENNKRHRNIYDRCDSMFDEAPDEEKHRSAYTNIFQAYYDFDSRSEALKQSLGLTESDIQRIQVEIEAEEKYIFQIEEEIQQFKEGDLESENKTLPVENIEYKGSDEERERNEAIFVFDKGEINIIMSRLIAEQTPLTTKGYCFTAETLFMCIRYLDSLNDVLTAQAFLGSYIETVKHTVKQRKYFDVSAYWLVNTHRLLNLLRQYAKADTDDGYAFGIVNRVGQQKQCLRNLDMSKSISALNEIGQWLAKKTIKLMKTSVMGVAVPALVENEETSHFGSNNLELRKKNPSSNLDRLLSELHYFSLTLAKYRVQLHLKNQLFSYLFEFLSSLVVSNLLCRKELCNNIRGTMIRCNLRSVENWTVNHRLVPACKSLAPAIQASRLIQIQPFGMNDVGSIKYYDKLDKNQIKKLLESYTPIPDYGYSVLQSINKKVEQILENRIDLDDTLPVELENSPVIFSFEPSEIHLEEIDAREKLNLLILKKFDEALG